jgi:Tfp pilus assembly protein PilV
MMINSHRRRRLSFRARDRRGFGLIPVIAVFAIAVTICAVWTKFSIRQHLDQRRSEERAQAAWLADAAIRRGAAMRTLDPDFNGETWVVAAEQIGRLSTAVVTIRVESVEGTPRAVRISARARYPQDNPRVTVSQSTVFNLPSSESPS